MNRHGENRTAISDSLDVMAAAAPSVSGKGGHFAAAVHARCATKAVDRSTVRRLEAEQLPRADVTNDVSAAQYRRACAASLIRAPAYRSMKLGLPVGMSIEILESLADSARKGNGVLLQMPEQPAATIAFRSAGPLRSTAASVAHQQRLSPSHPLNSRDARRLLANRYRTGGSANLRAPLALHLWRRLSDAPAAAPDSWQQAASFRLDALIGFGNGGLGT